MSHVNPRMRSESPKTTAAPAGTAPIFDQPSPIQRAGSATTRPASGPAAAMSKSEFLLRAGERIRMIAPSVPKRNGGAVGAGREVVAELMGAQDGQQRARELRAARHVALRERVDVHEGNGAQR